MRGNNIVGASACVVLTAFSVSLMTVKTAYAEESGKKTKSDKKRKTDKTGEKSTQLETMTVTDTSLAQADGLSETEVFESADTVKVINREQVEATGPVAGSAQALSIAPGVEVAGYGNTGSTKNSISINGIKQGWGGAAGGAIDNGSISVTFDGIPMVDPASGLWQTNEIPQMYIIQGTKVTYGPGEAKNRWYNNIGGQIDFVPAQPGEKASMNAQVTYGSYSTENAAMILKSGSHNGWSSVFAGGMGRNLNYRNSIGGFNNPASNYSGFFKLQKLFSNGDFSFGAYASSGVGYRPNYVPVNPIAGVTVNGFTQNGTSIPGQLYSQQTSGYYSALPYDIWHKKDYNRTQMFYGKLNVELDENTTFHNMTWYRHADRLHSHYYNYQQNTSSLFEYNNPHNDMYGDKAWIDFRLPYNTVSLGGFFLHDTYNTRNSFYNPYSTNPPDALYLGSKAVPNGNYRSDYFHATYLAGFIQDTIRPIENVEITPGIRLINYRINYNPGAQMDFPESYALAPSLNQAQLPAARTNFTKAEPSLSMRWQALSYLSLFANYGVAYREPSNGGGGGPFQSVPAYALRLEKGVEYQTGFKMHFDDLGPWLHNFLFSANYFDLTYSGQYIPISNAIGQYLSTAQGSSHYYGFNFALQDNLFDHFYTFANATIEKAKFQNYLNGGINYAGRWVSMVPNYTYNIGTYYQNTFPGSTAFYKARVWYQRIGSQHIFDNNLGAPSNQTMPSYGKLNLGLDINVPMFSEKRNLQLSANVLNVLDTKYNVYEYLSSGGYFGGNSQGAMLAYPGAPRTWYISMSVGL